MQQLFDLGNQLSANCVAERRYIFLSQPQAFQYLRAVLTSAFLRITESEILTHVVGYVKKAEERVRRRSRIVNRHPFGDFRAKVCLQEHQPADVLVIDCVSELALGFAEGDALDSPSTREK